MRKSFVVCVPLAFKLIAVRIVEQVSDVRLDSQFVLLRPPLDGVAIRRRP